MCIQAQQPIAIQINTCSCRTVGPIFPETLGHFATLAHDVLSGRAELILHLRLYVMSFPSSAVLDQLTQTPRFQTSSRSMCTQSRMSAQVSARSLIFLILSLIVLAHCMVQRNSSLTMPVTVPLLNHCM